MSYKKPVLKSYSASDILELLGPSCNQYTTTTLYTTTGNSSVNVDGMISSDGSVQPDTPMSVGDTIGNTTMRGFLGFNTSSIQGRTVVSATLRIYQSLITGAPYTDFLSSVIIGDHINFGSSLDASDYNVTALTSNIGTISNNITLEWKTLDVTNYVQADLNAGRTSSQFRLRFNPTELSANGSQDEVKFNDAENSFVSGNLPQLVVTYR